MVLGWCHNHYNLSATHQHQHADVMHGDGVHARRSRCARGPGLPGCLVFDVTRAANVIAFHHLALEPAF